MPDSMTEGTGAILEVAVEEEMTKSYMDYAMSVIVGRALPDVRDGLKPVQRRILWAMHEMGLGPDKPHKKSARVVGEVLGKYHPHGDLSVYEAMVRMAQEFNMRYALIDGHGNFGSIDGDAAAAMRYTEARLSKIAREMLRDIEKETVDYAPNFDDSLKEPTVLPSRIPNLLANGSAGIAVGMATNIPPHNLGELIDGAVALIDDREIGVEALLRHVKGPDFATGGLIIGSSGIKNAYRTGRGSIVMRAATEVVVEKSGRARILVHELPFQVNKAKLVRQMVELAKDRKIDGILDIRDETDRTGLRIAIEVRRDVNPEIVLNQLFKFTPMQQTFGVNMLALVGGSPEVLDLRSALLHYVDFQKEVVVRRSEHELKKALDRLHLVEGLRIALANLDAVVSLIRSSPNAETARQRLMQSFDLSEKQAQAILDMRLQRLVALEREKLEEEYRQLKASIDSLRTLLASEELLYQQVKNELLEVKKAYADQRRTRIVEDEATFEIEDLVVEEQVVVTLTRTGYVKRTPVSVYRSQKRGGRGLQGVKTKDEDVVKRFLAASTHDHLLVFTNLGRAYRIRVYDIPEHGRTAKGTALANLVPLQVQEGERATALVALDRVPEADQEAPSENGPFLFLATKRGVVKKTRASDLWVTRKAGIRAIALGPGDELVGVVPTSGRDELLLVTSGGKCIRFSEEDVRPMGRASRGVRGIRLAGDDDVIAVEKAVLGARLLAVSDDGFGKRTRIENYPLHSRGGKGVATLGLRRSAGRARAVDAVVIAEGEEAMLCTREGNMIRVMDSEVSMSGRAARGVRLIRLDPGDKVAALVRLC